MSDHRCHRSAMCSQWEKVDGQKVGVQIEAEIGLCEACRRHLEDVLPDLKADYANLGEAMLEPGAGSDQQITYTKELPVNIRLSIEALQSEIVHTAWTWAEIVARVMGIDGKTRFEQQHTRPSVLLDKCLTLLSGAVSVLLAVRDESVAVWTEEESAKNLRPIKGASRMLPAPAIDLGYTRKGQWDYEDQYGVDGAVKLIDLHHRTRRTLGLTKARHRHSIPCLRCEGQLTSAYGSDVVECGSCSFKRTRAEYEKLCLLLAERRGA